MSTHWHIVTPELPPDCGGVGDYTIQVARALLENGDAVTIYVPRTAPDVWRGLEVVALTDRFGAQSMQQLARRLARDRQTGSDARLLVQYVPAVFGRRGTNLPFCRWLLSQKNAGTDVRVMFHEPYLYLHWRPDHIVTAFTQRAMAAILLEAATHIYLSTETWRRYLARLRPEAISNAVTLPIPSAIPRVDAAQAVRATRTTSIGGAAFLVGHFGSYGDHIAPLLRETFKELLSSDNQIAGLCTGSGSDRFVNDMVARHPKFHGRLTASGRTPADDISVQLQACDVLMQPYPDGVTTRRTSVMAGLANGCAVATTLGKLTESVWQDADCVAMAPAGDNGALAHVVRQLLADSAARGRLRFRALSAYDTYFALRHTIDGLRAQCALPSELEPVS
jgi:glycosyltransferase involved in cell wall biosynthesis